MTPEELEKAHLEAHKEVLESLEDLRASRKRMVQTTIDLGKYVSAMERGFMARLEKLESRSEL